jgi:flagellin-specific chaperone FliS
MFVSQKLRKENIAEYVLYMWQVEDILRAYGCNLASLKRDYLSRFDCSEEEREDLVDWYANLIRMMTQEGCREQGHLQINKIVVDDMNELHRQLLDSNKFPFYRAEYYKVLPFIVELRKRGGDPQEHEIETCLNALYGVMMLRLQKREISPDTNHAIQEISTLIGMLSDYYHQDKTEGIDFEE